jgi:hypothetical protein
VVEGPDGPLYGWIKLGLEQYFDPDLMSMGASLVPVNAIVGENEPFVLRRTPYPQFCLYLTANPRYGHRGSM